MELHHISERHSLIKVGLCQVCQFIVNTDTFSPIMTMKNLVHNKLTRQNRFFAWLIQFWFLLFLTYCCHYLYPYSSYYYYRYWFYCFIIITIFYFCYSHHYYCSQYYQCYLFYFISFYFLLFILLWLLFACCVWRVWVSF